MRAERCGDREGHAPTPGRPDPWKERGRAEWHAALSGIRLPSKEARSVPLGFPAGVTPGPSLPHVGIRASCGFTFNLRNALNLPRSVRLKTKICDWGTKELAQWRL